MHVAKPVFMCALKKYWKFDEPKYQHDQVDECADPRGSIYGTQKSTPSNLTEFCSCLHGEPKYHLKKSL